MVTPSWISSAYSMRLTADEDRAHDVGEDEPLAQAPAADLEDRAAAPDLAALGGEDAELAGQRGQHQDRGVGRRERHVRAARSSAPTARG